MADTSDKSSLDILSQVFYEAGYTDLGDDMRRGHFGFLLRTSEEEYAADLLSDELDFIQQTDLDSITARLYLERELSGPDVPKTKLSRRTVSKEIKRLQEDLGLSYEEAKKLFADEIRQYLDSFMFEIPASRVIDIGKAFLGKLKKEKLKDVKEEDNLFNFYLDLREVNDLVSKMSNAKILTKKDLEEIDEKVYELDAIRHIASAVQDALLEEINWIYTNPVKKKSFLLYSVCLSIAEKMKSVIEISEYFERRVNLAGNDIRREITDMMVVERVDEILAQIKNFLGKIKLEGLEIIATAESIARKIMIFIKQRVYGKKQEIPDISQLQLIDAKIDYLSNELRKIFYNMFGSKLMGQASISGSYVMSFFSNIVLTFRSISSEIITAERTFTTVAGAERTGEYNEYFKTKTNIEGPSKAPRELIYQTELRKEENQLKYIFSVSDKVLTNLKGLGIDSKTAKNIKALISQGLFGRFRPDLIHEIDLLVTEKIIKNLEGSLA